MNILHIMADQLTAFALRAWGNQVCQTPHLDALAARGAVFDNCYCNFPVCAPARASMLTGRLASRLGIYDNASEFPASAPTLPYYMSALGYHTSLAGKMHFVGPDQLHGYQERLTTDIYPSDFGWTPDWRKMIPVAATGLNLRSVVESGTCRRSLQLDYDDEVAARAVQRLYDYGRDRTRPFFLTVSFTHPHNPYVITDAYWNRYDAAAIDAPAVPPLADAEHDPHSRRLRQIYRFDEYRVSRDDVMRARHAYYGMISYVDDQVGKLLAALDAMDLSEDTVIIFTADHGDMLGERGLWYKWTLFEHAVRIPLIIAVPGQPATRVAEPVSLLDLLPTCIDIGSHGERTVTPVSDIEGASLWPRLTRGAALPPERPVFAEMNADGALSPCLMVRRGPWKYIHSDSDPPQLFQLEHDPHELDNLAGSPQLAAIEDGMRALMHGNWDLPQLARAVVSSAEQRLFIQRTRLAGEFAPWDFEPRKDASQQFVRNGANGSATVVKGRARYPFVAPKSPDRILCPQPPTGDLPCNTNFASTAACPGGWPT